jgi:DNA polymerase
MINYTRTPAGLGVSTKYAFIDFETYSEAGYSRDPVTGKWKSEGGLKGVGGYVYAEHPTTEVHCLAYWLPDPPIAGLWTPGTHLWVPGMPPPEDLFAYIRYGGIIEAWNSGFEQDIWDKVCVPRLGWPPLPYAQMRDTAAKALAYGLPGKLSECAKALRCDEQKDTAGTHLINWFCVPKDPIKDNPNRRRIHLRDDPVKAQEFLDYCVQDVWTGIACSELIPDLDATELEYWFLSEEINRRGVAVDREALENCIAIVEQAKARYEAELAKITFGQVCTGNQTEAMREFLTLCGLHLDDMKKPTVADTLKRTDILPICRRILEIRKILSSNSVLKVYSIKARIASDGRLHRLFQFAGASRTSRWAGRGPQPQNLPSSGPPVVMCETCGKYASPALFCCGANAEPHDWDFEAARQALQLIATRDIDAVELVFGDALKTVSGCLRALFVAGAGKELICSDYSAIEAVCLAMLAGEKWREEVFRTHGKIYEMSASKTTGIPFEEFEAYKQRTDNHHPMRKKIGKPYELGCGYGGWIGAVKAFGADKFYNNDNDIKTDLIKWRAASPNIVEFWGEQLRRHPDRWEFWPELHGLEGALVCAMLNPGTAYTCRGLTYYRKPGGPLFLRLLSGRHITYHEPQLTIGPHVSQRGKVLSDNTKYTISYMGWNNDRKKGPLGWVRLKTYGGKEAEHACQATARDILAHGLVRLDRAGYPVVLHVHDEATAEVGGGCGSVEEFEREMSIMPHWAADWPVFARGGWRGREFRKD